MSQGQLQSVRVELESCRSRLTEAEQQASERGAAASRALAQHDEARDQARHAHCELQLLRVAYTHCEPQRIKFILALNAVVRL